MNVLFVHNNFPAQYKHLAAALAAEPHNRIVAIGSVTARDIAGVELHRYDFRPDSMTATHPFARRFDFECRRAEQVLYLAAAIAGGGFRPDTIVVHSGWGENLPLRAIFPSARIVNYCEFYYRPFGQDVNFDPEFPKLSIDGTTSLMAKNAAGLLGLVDCDAGLAPTAWQRSTFPAELQSKIEVIHEGIDVTAARPDLDAAFALDSGRVLKKGDEVVTFVSRYLEPLRGYHMFMRALPKLLRDRPKAEVVIVGGTDMSYGQAAPAGRTWKDIYLDEVASEIDLSRVHFLGRVDYGRFLRMLQVSAVHVYLTYPFVLSWSCLEAMSCGCLVVGAEVAPVTEVIDGTNGVLVPFFDAEAIADAIVGALADPARYDTMRLRARATILGRFDAQKICIPAGLKLLKGD